MKKFLMTSMIACICLSLMMCKKNNNYSKTNNADNHSYSLKLSFNYDSWPAATFTWTLRDTASLEIDIKNGVVSFSGIQNKDGLVLPASQLIQGVETCTATWQSGESPTGYINITGGTGELYLGANESTMVALHITSSNAVTPRFTYVCTRSGSTATGGDILESNDYFYTFTVNNQTQSQNISNLTATLTPN
jgi:hypothetical protein